MTTTEAARPVAAPGTLQLVARSQPPASDWCYVHNVQDARRPRALKQPTGTGRRNGYVRRFLEARPGGQAAMARRMP
jgi:hypothetical protein